MPLSISISSLNRPPPLLCSPLLADLAITGDTLLQLLISRNSARSASRAARALSISLREVARQRKRGEMLGEEERKGWGWREFVGSGRYIRSDPSLRPFSVWPPMCPSVSHAPITG